jgi:hypothetical protein
MFGGGRLARQECDFNSLNAELNLICHFLAFLGAHHILHVSRINHAEHCFFLNEAPRTLVEVHVLKSHSDITSNQTGTLPKIYTATLINANSSATIWPNNGTNVLKSFIGYWRVIIMWFSPVCSDTTTTKEVLRKERMEVTQETGKDGQFIKCIPCQEVLEAVIVSQQYIISPWHILHCEYN